MAKMNTNMNMNMSMVFVMRGCAIQIAQNLFAGYKQYQIKSQKYVNRALVVARSRSLAPKYSYIYKNNNNFQRKQQKRAQNKKKTTNNNNNNRNLHAQMSVRNAQTPKIAFDSREQTCRLQHHPTVCIYILHICDFITLSGQLRIQIAERIMLHRYTPLT